MDERRALLMVVLWLAVSVEVRWCLENVKEKADLAAGKVKLKVEEAKQTAEEVVQDAKDKGGSWADWAYEKFTE